VTFRESYLGSGAQARAVVGGFDADVVALALAPDVESVVKAGLVTHDWKAAPHGGMVTRSVVVIGVREGNPKGIHDWDDLTRPDVEVLTPDLRMSGGARWNVAAIYGAALRGGTRAAKGDPAAAEAFLADVLRRVKVMDRGARDSMLTFERGVGDAIVTYENEIIEARRQGQKYDYVVPRSTILIENPAAVVDAYVDRHGTRDLAEAFVAYLVTPEAQRAFAEHGFRPVDEATARELAGQFPAVGDLFSIGDLGGWSAVERELFAPGAAYDRALKAAGGHAP
jgi:sulfate transport system substrate-binding protein